MNLNPFSIPFEKKLLSASGKLDQYNEKHRQSLQHLTHIYWNREIKAHIMAKCTSEIDIKTYAVITLNSSFKEAGLKILDIIQTPFPWDALAKLALAVKDEQVRLKIKAQMTAFALISKDFNLGSV